jgi:signal transduction histidine kinase/PAS domain-containing protein
MTPENAQGRAAPGEAPGPGTSLLRLDRFQRTGEMGRRIAEFDWENTSLGRLENWPRSLQSTIAILLGSRYPMCLAWGEDMLLFYNDAYITLLGAKHPEALGRTLRETFSESWDSIGTMVSAVMSTGTPTWVPGYGVPLRRHGYVEESYFSASASAVDDDVGEIGGMLCVCSEITEQVVHARRTQLLRELATAETHGPTETCEHLGRIVTEHPLDVPFAAFYLRSTEGDALELRGGAHLPASPVFPRRVALDDTHAIIPFARCMAGEVVTLDDLDRHVAHLGGQFSAPVTRALVMPIAPFDRVAPLGVVVAAVSPARALDDAYRTFYELLVARISTSIRNAMAFEAERKRAEELAEIDRVKTAFFSNVSHEFRTPLTLILGPIEDALADPERSLHGEDLEAVHRAALRLLRLVNNLLDFSRVEAGRMNARFEPTDLAALTAGLAGSFRSLVESAGLKLVVDCPALDAPVYVDRSHWEKIVLNLVSNAFKFTFEGQIAVALHARARAIELSVSDTGTGIPEADLSRVFERFHRVEGARGRSFEGTGIGLALVEEVVKQHGGTVRVDSVVGKGTTFVVAIPQGDHLSHDKLIAPGPTTSSVDASNAYVLEAAHWGASSASNDVVAPGHAASPDAATSSKAPGARILVADDNADMRQYLTRLLSPSWAIETVADGEAALAAALRAPPDLVLSDVMMPRMDGVALLRALRADPRTRTLPVILLSARAGEQAVSSGLQTGADDYVLKPFSARELVSRVGTHLELARVRQAAVDAATELAEARAAHVAELERKNNELAGFSDAISHELRGPLRSIDGFSEILIEDHGESLGPKGLAHLQRVRAAGRRMAELIDDLLRLSRIERAELRRASLDLSGIALRVGEALQRAHPDRAVQLVVEQALVVEADAGLMTILLENLLENAWKFTAHTELPRVELGAIDAGGQRTFFVKDNGVGFNPIYISQLFTPFHRLHSDTDFPGTGIGLATVRRIVERHGGTAWAEGKVHGGAAVYWTLSPPSSASS